MQRTTLVAAGLFVVLGITALVLGRAGGHKAPAPSDQPVASAASVAAPSPAPSAAASAPLAANEIDAEPSSGFDTLPDGRHVPELPATAPTSLSFGVVLFSYAGAQAAPEASRSKDEAKRRAASVIEDAKRDFKAAVSKGDRGSTADAGRIPRGVLEPAVEYALFSLEKGAVHPEPVDTPRGYWVLRRND
jgi:hypothetical protein